jgi:cation diffusion facilitator CzcD-associated flavoprotein CzcO
MGAQGCAVAVIGAGFAGLGVCAALRARGIEDFILLEQGTDVGHFWSNTYDRLHLHSPWHGIARDGNLGRGYPMYKSRDDVVAFCRSYARQHGLYAHLHHSRRVTRLARAAAGGSGECEWQIETSAGAYAARFVAVATAINRVPVVPPFDRQAAFRGEVLHSAAYRAPTPFAGRRVLVVGSGNSAAEIALDLAGHGAAHVALWVRGARHFLPRAAMTVLYQLFRALGFMSGSRFAAAHAIPYGSAEFWRTVRARDAFVGRFSVDLSRFGIRKPALRPQEETFRHGRIPVIDVGAIRAIRRGRIEVIDGVERPLRGFGRDGVRLGDREEPFDSVVLATGFEPKLEAFIADRELLGPVRWARSLPLTDGCSRSRVHPSAFFPGFDVSINGCLSLGLWGWQTGERIADALGAAGSSAEMK